MAACHVLVATLGQSDVQVVIERPVDGPPRRTCHKIHRGVKAFHQFFLDHPERFEILPARDLNGVTEEPPSFEFVADHAALVPSLGLNDSDAWPTLEPSVEIRVRLCCQLMRKVVAELDRIGVDRERLQILLLNTRRFATGHDGEPLAAGAIVRAFLLSSLELRDHQVTVCDFLQDGEPLCVVEAPTGVRHLNPAAARRIDVAVRSLRGRLPDALRRRATALVADSAGIPDARPVLAAACHLHFGPENCRFIGPREGAARVLPGRMIAPADSLETRRRVGELLDGGNISGAAALARIGCGRDVLAQEPWRDGLGRLAQAMHGQPVDAPREGAIGGMIRAVQALTPPALFALRTEAALRMENLPEALVLTFGVFESLLRLLADLHLSAPGRHCLDEASGRIRLADMEDAKRRAFLERTGNPVLTDSSVIGLLRDQQKGLLHVLRDDLNAADRASLEGAHKALNAAPVADARNTRVHWRIDGPTLDTAARHLREAGLWSRGTDGFLCLEQPWIRESLCGAALASESPFSFNTVAEVYSGIAAAVREDMEVFSFRLLDGGV